MPILIGNNLFIEELPVDYNGKLLDLDPYIAPLNTFFDKLEVVCVRECCGIEASSFMPEDIQKALVGLSAETVIIQLKAMQTAIEEQYWCKTLSSTILNNNFDRKVFLQLLDHIVKMIEKNIAFLGE
ncbi:DUF6331 family protein [uncultured Capnocytophaga sp.]|uniref:DUF6331 family protein n=1 Tax=uncultured Capnocytophaga sp. TaxID=159273 RepID=UPI00263663DF|nr:DUF6331 family protein [uncultured Capnocytophaga sp.]